MDAVTVRNTPLLELHPLSRIAPESLDNLLDRAFGPDRHERTAYRIREGTAAIAEMSYAATLDGKFVGSVQCWPVTLACDAGGRHPLVMVGPVAVDPACQREGTGRLLMRHMLARADARPDTPPLILIGDPEYYGRFFGFTADATGGWRLPGPFERHRLLARGAAVPGCAGMLGPRVTADV